MPTTTNSSVSADTPIPSIESDSWVRDSSEEGETSIRSRRTPSVSISPPPEPISNGVRSQSLGLASQMRSMQLSGKNDKGLNSNLTELLHAVDAVGRGSDDQIASPDPETAPSPSKDPSTPRRRRRSGRSPSASIVSPHNVQDEPVPEDIFHSPSFQKAFNDAKQLTSNIKSVLDGTPLIHDPEATISKLHQEAVELSSFQYPTTRKIGFVGDSGVGKSSLLNSLLDFKDLARTSNRGEACTCVVTEYHYHNHEYMDIKVELFSTDELKDQIERMLEDYRHYSLHAERMETAEEKKAAKDKANLARDTFRAMFRDRLTNESFLIQGSEIDVFHTLTSWARDARPSETIVSQQRLSLQTCSDALVRLSSEPPSRSEPAIWPFIKSIKVFLSAHVLKQGLVLVDLPGLRDLNSARRCITERYILECDEIFVICNIGRAVTDEGVQHVFDLAQRARLRNVGIVCTRSDDILPNEALRDWDGARQTRIKNLMAVIDTDKQELRELKREIKEFEEDLDDLSDEEKNDYLELMKSSTNVERKIKDHDFELTKFLVTTRNEFVTKKLHTKYNSRADGQLRVFSISNKYYREKRDEPRDQSLPYLELSGIIGVRKHCISIVAQAQRRVVLLYINDRIPALISKIQLWVQSGARTADQERLAATISALDSIERQLRRNLRSHSGPAQIMQREFNALIYENRRPLAWSQFSAGTSQDRNGWHHSTYRAFCSNYGNHSTPKGGTHDWNSEAMEQMQQDLEEPWEVLSSKLQQCQSEVTLSIETTTGVIHDRIEELGDEMESADTLMEALEAQKRLLKRSLEVCFDELDDKLRLLHTDTFSGIRTSLFGKQMEPTYRKCNQEYGTGSDQRRKRIMNDGFSNQAHFKKLLQDFKESFEDNTDEMQDEWKIAKNEYLRVVEEILDLIRSEKAVRESEQDPGFRDHVESIIRRGNDDIRRIQDVVRE